MGRSHSILAFIRLGRPHFLVGGLVLYSLGVAIALFRGAPFHWSAFVWGQIAVTGIQWMTHYANEYFDLETDRANRHRTRWAGGSGILPSAVLHPWIALVAACILSLIVLIATLVLVFGVRTGYLTLPLISFAWLLAWFYSAPPLKLHSTGLGEFTTAFLVPVLTPLVGFYLQTGLVASLPLMATVPLAAFQFAFLLVIEFPDAESDRLFGKRTLVVRLGSASAVRMHNLALLFAYVSLPGLILAGLPPVVAGAFLPGLPLASWQIWRMTRGAATKPIHWDDLALVNILLLIGSAGAELLIFGGLAYWGIS